MFGRRTTRCGWKTVKREEKEILMFQLRYSKLPPLFTWSRCERLKETRWNSTSFTRTFLLALKM
nr:CBL-interacting serine/threonine-protein kinase 26 [Ipomoea batatas]GMD64801.1 CBL-interacting serine/threonine-protein kinase 26 [Ipomoea batatas]